MNEGLVQMLGASAPESRELFEQLADAAVSGRAVFVWTDGEDITALLEEEGDEPGLAERWANQAFGVGP